MSLGAEGFARLAGHAHVRVDDDGSVHAFARSISRRIVTNSAAAYLFAPSAGVSVVALAVSSPSPSPSGSAKCPFATFFVITAS